MGLWNADSSLSFMRPEGISGVYRVRRAPHCGCRQLVADRNNTGYYSGRKAHGCRSGFSNSMVELCRKPGNCWPIATEFHLWFASCLFHLNGVGSYGPHPPADLNVFSGYADRASSDGLRAMNAESSDNVRCSGE